MSDAHKVYGAITSVGMLAFVTLVLTVFGLVIDSDIKDRIRVLEEKAGIESPEDASAYRIGDRLVFQEKNWLAQIHDGEVTDMVEGAVKIDFKWYTIRKITILGVTKRPEQEME